MNTKKFKTSTEKTNGKNKLNFNFWLDDNEMIFVKINYKRFGTWEYRLKDFKKTF